MKKVFISYTRLDPDVSIDLLKWISTNYSQNNYIFIDAIHNDSQDRQQRVEAELNFCDMIILIYSKNILNSKWVLLEIAKGEERGIPIIKIPIDRIMDRYRHSFKG